MGPYNLHLYQFPGDANAADLRTPYFEKTDLENRRLFYLGEKFAMLQKTRIIDVKFRF